MSDKNCDEEIRALLAVIEILTSLLIKLTTPPKAPVIKGVEIFTCK